MVRDLISRGHKWEDWKMIEWLHDKHKCWKAAGKKAVDLRACEP